jgi:outer membrane protein OmpA-like peptidoglycan-associated protein
MRHHVRVLSAITAGFAALGMSQSAHAEDYSLHLDPGLVVPLTSPQSDIYNPGMGLGAKFMFRVCPWASVGPSMSAVYLPKVIDDGSNAGVYWQFGGSLRLQHVFGERDSVNVFRPWADLDLMGGHTGNVWNPAFDVGLGIEGALDRSRSAWMGPFVRWTHSFQTASAQEGITLDKRDPNLLWAGLEISFDFPTHQRVRKVVVHDMIDRPVVIHQTVVVHDQVATVSSPIASEMIDLGKVYFNWDSPKVRNWEQSDKIEQLLAVLKSHHTTTVHVQGHASADGQRAHNLTLAGQRADAVIAYLIAHGVDASRIVTENKGIDSPSHDNGTQEGRERNRRVEFEVDFTAVEGK